MNKKQVLLTDEEIIESWTNKGDEFTHHKMIAKAQLKAVVKWLEEPCPHRSPVPNYLEHFKRRYCIFCLADLKKQVEE